MDGKKSFASRMEAFFAGKGFYIVLFLCVAVIGVSAWSMLAGSGAGEEAAGLSMAVGNLEEDLLPAGAAAAPTPAPTTAPTPVVIPEASVPLPAATPAPAAEPEYFIWPVAGSVETPYAMTALRFDRTMQDWRTHDGVDIAAELGAQVKAIGSGRVEEIREDDLFGTVVVLSHREGLMSVYANLAAVPTVAVGDTVVRGQVLGAVGDTALAEAGEVCHLHFAMLRGGESVDPMDYLP